MATHTGSTESSLIDVLIVGAGPAGIMAANALARLGISVRIVDQSPVGVSVGQADGIQPRTIEVFQSYGLAERLIREGNQMHSAAFYNPNADGFIELTDRVPDVTAPTARYPFEVRFPYTITLHQGAIEAIFFDSMRANGVEAERPVVPTSIELSQDEAAVKDMKEYPVKVTLKNLASGKTEDVKAKFMIGADGAHSWVRKTLDIAMEGEQSKYAWGVIDILPDSDFPDIRNKTVVHSNSGSCMIIPREGDKIRVYIQLEDELIAKAITSDTRRVDKTKLTPEQLLDVAKKIFHPYRLEARDGFEWWTIYIIGQRVAAHYSIKDRIFIAGDACHTHSPKAGQGMNASMGDSHNLSWKIASVIHGWAQPSVLGTYESERRKYAQDLISFDKQFSTLFSGKPRTEEYQDGVSHEEFLKIFQTFGGFTSGIGIHYEPSPIVDHANLSLATEMGLPIGERYPPRSLIRAADARPVDIQDLLPADGRFKIVLLLGKGYHLQDKRSVLDKIAKELEGTLSGFVNQKGGIAERFDIVTVVEMSRRDANVPSFPPLLRSHWSKILLDEAGPPQVSRGRSDSGGVEVSEVAVAVRPDGYIGAVVPLDNLEGLQEYFSRFMTTN